MAVTRSASGATARAAARKTATTDTSEPSRPAQASASTKRKANTVPKTSRKKIKATVPNGAAEPERTEAVSNPTLPVLEKNNGDVPALVPAVLTFSFEDAKQHLITTDPRFEDVFGRLKCKPFEHLERVDPFRCVPFYSFGDSDLHSYPRTLVNSIMYANLVICYSRDDPDAMTGANRYPGLLPGQ